MKIKSKHGPPKEGEKHSLEYAMAERERINMEPAEIIFAWIPVRVSNEKIIWLEHVERKRVSPYVASSESLVDSWGIYCHHWAYWYYKYSEVNKH